MCGRTAAAGLSRCRLGAVSVPAARCLPNAPETIGTAPCSQPASPWQPRRVPGSTGRSDAGDIAGLSCSPEPLFQC